MSSDPNQNNHGRVKLHFGPKAPPIKKIVRLGLIVLIVFLGGFLLWASVMPLESAAVASGRIVVESHLKTIEHLEGGIIQKIFVAEGDLVKEGAPLIQLDQTQTEANLKILKDQTNLLLARKAWLDAIKDNLPQVVFPDRLLKKADDPQIKKIMDDAVALFVTKRKTIEDGDSILNSRIEQLKNQLKGLKEGVDSYDKQISFINEEIEALLILEKQNYVDKPRLLLLKRQAASLEGEKGEKVGLIAQTEEKIAETELQKLSLKNSAQNDILKESAETELQLVTNAQKEVSAEDVLKRSLIVSPIEGRVLNLRVHTVGGVIGPREPLLDIVPTEDTLIVEAHIQPRDIEVVHIGLTAKVRFLNYRQRGTPTVDGKVTYVAADIEKEEKTGEMYYTVNIEVSAKEMAKVPEIKLYPGMPVQVNIVIEKRTAMAYFLTPVFDSFSRAFREP